MARRKKISRSDIIGDKGIALIHRLVLDMGFVWNPTGLEAEPQYLILNIAVGGAWGGQKGIDDGIFPQRMCVDYVRVYQRPGPAQAAPAAR